MVQIFCETSPDFQEAMQEMSDELLSDKKTGLPINQIFEFNRLSLECTKKAVTMSPLKEALQDPKKKSFDVVITIPIVNQDVASFFAHKFDASLVLFSPLQCGGIQGDQIFLHTLLNHPVILLLRNVVDE